MHKFEVKQVSTHVTEVWMDGEKLHGVYRVDTTHSVNELPGITISFHAGRVDIVDASKTCDEIETTCLDYGSRTYKAVQC